MKPKRKATLNKLLIFAQPRKDDQMEAFKKVCDELEIKPVFMKRNAGTALEPENGIVSAVVFQTHDTGNDLNLISEIKLTLRNIPIIFYSTRYSEGIEALIRRIGVHYFLTPSFDKEELALVLEALMEKTGNGSPQRIE